MAVCSGCTAGGCTCVVDGVTITGTGVLGDPFVSVGGSGTCAQKNLYTVSTIGVQGLGFYLGTAEPFLSCADFIGDGVNDEVAINAACTAAVGTFLIDVYTEVYLNSGIFTTSASIDAQAASIKGSTRTIVTNAVAASGFPLLIDPTVLQDLSIGPLLASNNECTIQLNSAQNLRFDNVLINNAGLGAGTAIVEINNSGDVRFEECRFTGAGNMAATFFISGFVGRVEFDRNRFTSCRLDLTMMTFGSRITDNSFELGQGPIVGNQGMINLNHEGTNVAISNWIISGNNISQSAGHGIVINGGANPSGFYAWALVHDNLIYGYGGDGVNIYDGIFVTGNVDEISIQGNKCGGIVSAGARHGINISAATCNDNFVTNNDLFNSGASASFNDAGTATITAAGNRL